MKGFRLLINPKGAVALLFAMLNAINVSAQIAGTPTQNNLISTTDHVVAYEIVGDNVVFVMEAITDLTDNMKGISPDVDFMSIRVDYNHNGIVDEHIDRSFGTKSGGLGFCSQLLINQSKGTSCEGFKSEGYVELSFRRTKNGLRDHPVYVFTIPMKELSHNKDSARVVFTFFSSGRGFTNYPTQPKAELYSFVQTTQVKLGNYHDH